MKLEQVIEFMPESIRPQVSRRTFRPGEFVVRKGERADHVYILTKGTTRVSNEFASGQRYTGPTGPPALPRWWGRIT